MALHGQEPLWSTMAQRTSRARFDLLKGSDTFRQDAMAALSSPRSTHETEGMRLIRAGWNTVCRLCLAPLLESLIAVDRLLFVRASLDVPVKGGKNRGLAALIPLFDPALSPRNFVVVGLRDSML